MMNNLPDPEFSGDDDMEEARQKTEAFIRALEERRTGLTAQGIDVDEKIGMLRGRLKDFAKAHRAKEEFDEKLLQSTADLADSERDLFKFLAPIVDAKHAELPFDPKIQEMKEQIDEWRKHMPKEE